MGGDRADSAAVEAYIETAPEAARALLREIRRRIWAAVPTVTENLAYGMPAYGYREGHLLHFAAAKRHVGVYGLVHADAGVPEELLDYFDHRSTLRFRFDRPLPWAAFDRALQSKVGRLERAV